MLIVMVTRIVVFFHMGIALDPVATEPEGFVFASGRVDKPPLPDVSARLWLCAQLLAALCDVGSGRVASPNPVGRTGCGEPIGVIWSSARFPMGPQRDLTTLSQCCPRRRSAGQGPNRGQQKTPPERGWDVNRVSNFDGERMKNS